MCRKRIDHILYCKGGGSSSGEGSYLLQLYALGTIEGTTDTNHTASNAGIGNLSRYIDSYSGPYFNIIVIFDCYRVVGRGIDFI